MKQLLLLLTIHFLIFHQKNKDKKEKFLDSLEKKTTANSGPVKSWDFLTSMREHSDRKYRTQAIKPAVYYFSDYTFLNALIR